MKTYKEILEDNEYVIGDKISYKKHGRGQKRTGIIHSIDKRKGYVYIDNGATTVDIYDIIN